jgi:hypothetical protein
MLLTGGIRMVQRLPWRRVGPVSPRMPFGLLMMLEIRLALTVDLASKEGLKWL